MTAAVTELYDALRKAGVDEMTAMGAAKAVSGSDLSHLATRADLQSGLAELKTELKMDIADMKTEIMGVRAEIMGVKAEIIKWNTGTLIAATGIFAAIVKLF